MAQATVDVQAPPPFEIADILRIVKRRWLHFAIPAAIGSAISLLVALYLPATYRATARILVESQQISEELAQSTVTASASERISILEQWLFSRDVLLRIADDFNLYSDKENFSPSDVVGEMRANASIRSVALARDNRRVAATAVNISFDDRNPGLAAAVANEFVTLLLERNASQRAQQASGTLIFFEAEVERLAAALQSVELQITNFKNANSAALPESLEFRRSEAARLEEKMFEREVRRIELEDQLREIERARAAGLFLGDARDLLPEERELEQLENALAQQRAVFAESHPSVRSLASRVAALREIVDEKLGVEDGDEAGEQRSTFEIERQVFQIERQLELIGQQRVADEARLEELAASIARTPQVATTLNALMRELATLQAQYQEAVLKRADAQVGERLEASQRAERFQVIEQAQTPETPERPNRRLIAAAGVVASFGLGGGIALLFELLNQSIRTPNGLLRQTELRAIVTIPRIQTERERRFWKWFWILLVLSGVIAVAAAAFAIDQFYLPLPIVFEKVLDRFGFL